MTDLYCGFVPLKWLRVISENRAAHSATKMALLIWHRAGVERRGQDLPLTYKRAKECLGIGPDSFGRGLAELERLGLIKAERARGRAIRVSIVDYETYKRGGVKA
ncbi:hypothetical protein [Methanocalculus natronophilus]|uniref:hypothetical protein n=1 Tax=Methanocalculus natronophilus TaxID=1262400 RepID=UPI0031B5AF40